MVYDRTCRGRALLPGLTHAWWSGGVLYRTMRRFDAWYGARTWEEALTWLGRVGERAPLAEIQFWGHGKWGLARVDREALDLSALTRDHRHHAALRKIRAVVKPGADPANAPQLEAAASGDGRASA